MKSRKQYDVVVIGGGQSALACGYFLRRTTLNYILLDDQHQPGGSWSQMWESLTLFSPAGFSSLPGWLMPDSKDKYPGRQHTINYLAEYEERYQIPVERPVRVNSVIYTDNEFRLETSKGICTARAVISATGTWSSPYIPSIKDRDLFQGNQIHSSCYFSPTSFAGKKTLIVGEGNTGEQLLAELSLTTEVRWSTKQPPSFMPDEVDGRVLFDVATAKYQAQRARKEFDSASYNPGNIVMVPSVIDARDRGILVSKGAFIALTKHGVIWENGEEENFDSIIWCTGFTPATNHLSDLVPVGRDGKIQTDGNRAIQRPGLWLVGYGNWTGFASATLIGVGRSARTTVHEIQNFLISIPS